MADLKKDHPLHGIWAAMKRRCYNKNTKDYPMYGGRGITVCDEWHTFEGFIKDMEQSYRPGLSIDRVDNEKGYFFNNCRWATPTEQANNRTTSRIVVHNGKSRTLAQWARDFGIAYGTMTQRFYVYKWDFSRCLEPVRKRS